MNEKMIIDKLLEHDKQFELLEKAISSKFDLVLTRLDQLHQILTRLDKNSRLLKLTK